ncbi:hypothetical protein CISIN_1g047457mg [Citrus sinensis]|uniref:Uncharacterized protein n=1 Tax=Citrus sinensis TaxID=2711 RepID=A0A067D6T5_CITSI|nr:hypothetical protein CISIN_1g047457mg [Citrus sinensis]
MNPKRYDYTEVTNQIRDKIWIESKKVWCIAGPAPFSLLAAYCPNILLQAFDCHLYVLAAAILKYLSQRDEVAELSGYAGPALILAFSFPLQNSCMQSQLKSRVIAWSFLVAVLSRCVLVYVPDFGVFGAAAAFDISGWVSVFGMFGYSVFGGCPLTRNGFSMRAFSGIWDFVKLSAAAGVMLCLENRYCRILIMMTEYLKNATLIICGCFVMSLGWQWAPPAAGLSLPNPNPHKI